KEDCRQVRDMPGVETAVKINAIPLGGSGWSMGLKTVPGPEVENVPTAVYFVDEHGLDALGVELVAGENFAPSDVTWREPATRDWSANTLLSKELAAPLFPADPTFGVGKTVYLADTEHMTF